MALLVFTDFACWAPIAFFGLTALLGYPLINVTQTKILLVFFYPLNSCANPCLYALLTQQYRRDFFILMGRYGLCKDRAELHKGAIGGKPLPYGSGPQYKRTCSEGGVNKVRLVDVFLSWICIRKYGLDLHRLLIILFKVLIRIIKQFLAGYKSQNFNDDKHDNNSIHGVPDVENKLKVQHQT